MHVFYPLAALAYLVQLILLVGLHLRTDYSPVSHAVSDYGVGPAKGQFAIYGLVGSVAATLVAIAVLADARLPARAGFYLLAMAALRLGVIAFPTDLEGRRSTSTGKLHYLFAISSFALAYMAIDAMHPAAIVVVNDWARPLLGLLWWLLTLSLAGVVICLVPALRRVFGFVERLYLVSVILWLGLFAIAI